MSEEKKDYHEREEYKNLPRPRQALVDAVIGMMGTTPEWHRGWKACDVPLSMRNTPYRGENNVTLTIASLVRGYGDPRWMTFKQMRQSGWSFKTDENGKSMGKDAGVPVSFFELRDKKTKKAFDRASVRLLSNEEREKYMRDNVYPLRKTYVVFNASIIKGVPEYAKKDNKSVEERSAEADRFMDFWDAEKTPIRYGGDRSCFVTKKNLIRLPRPEAFTSMPEFYATAFHEISHSCQGFTRPGVDLSTDMGSPEYKKDELSAELSGVFLSQKLCGAIDTKALYNSAAYLNSWLLGESDEGKMFFDAVSEADKLSKYAIGEYEARVEERETQKARETQRASDAAVNAELLNGPVRQASLFDETPMGGGEKMKSYNPENGRVDLEKMKAEISARMYPADPLAFRMNGDGVVPSDAYEARMNLLDLEDRKIVEEALSGVGPNFKTLYFGGKIPGEPEIKNVHALATYCAFIGGDEETAKRLFKGSAYGDSISDDYLGKITKSAVDYSRKFYGDMTAEPSKKDGKEGK